MSGPAIGREQIRAFFRSPDKAEQASDPDEFDRVYLAIVVHDLIQTKCSAGILQRLMQEQFDEAACHLLDTSDEGLPDAYVNRGLGHFRDGQVGEEEPSRPFILLEIQGHTKILIN